MIKEGIQVKENNKRFDIAFVKAKRNDTNQWIDGYLYEESDGKFCVRTKILLCDALFDYEMYQVDENTLCNCTGAKDIEGTLMFDNDVLTSEIDKKNTLIIKYNQERFKWEITSLETNKIIDLDIKLLHHFGFKVVGNLNDEE